MSLAADTLAELERRHARAERCLAQSIELGRRFRAYAAADAAESAAAAVAGDAAEAARRSRACVSSGVYAQSAEARAERIRARIARLRAAIAEHAPPIE